MPKSVTPGDILLATCVFGLVVGLWLVGVILWSMRRQSLARKLQDRLRLVGPEVLERRVLRLWHEGQEVTTVSPGQTRKVSLVGRLEQLRQDAGWQMPLRSLILALLGGMTLAGAVTMAVSSSLLLAGLMAVAVVMLASLFTQHCIGQRVALFERQMVDALQLAARSLRAGHPLLGALRLVSEEMNPPVSMIFGEICQQQAMGASLEQAVRQAAARSANFDMHIFATSLIIQLRSGGNLADMMERLAMVVRDRIRLSRRARVLTAQTQLSKRVLLALPFLVFLGLSFLNPGYMLPLYTTGTGRWLLLAAALLLLLGWWIMRRMGRLKY